MMVSSDAPVSESEKREALDAVLASSTFARSAQLRTLLRYICESELAGNPEQLTEYHIAVEALGRRKDVDLSDDASVRNRAYELRQRLEKFYSSEQPHAVVRIQIPRGGYVPFYTRQPAALPERMAPLVSPVAPAARTFPWLRALIAGAVCLAAGVAAGALLLRPHPPSIVREAWGPLAAADGDLLISIATNMHMIVRPHIPPHSQRLPAPDVAYTEYGPNRPLGAGTPLFMEPAQLSVPLGELSAAATLANMRTAFGGSYQILPESEAPVTALRGRNGVLIGSGTNSHAAQVLLRNLPFSINYTEADMFAVFDHRKPAGQNQLFLSQPTGWPVASEAYGLLSVITSADSLGRPRRTLVFSGTNSAGVQAAVEFFCSDVHQRQMKERFRAAGIKGFPPIYQVVVRSRNSGVRMISYEYAAHAVAEK